MTGRGEIESSSSKSREKSASLPAAKRIKKDGTQAEDNNEGNATSSSSSPMEKAIKNTLVLQNIFKFLSYNDLLTCRSVELPFWSSEAEYSMSQRPLLTVELSNPGNWPPKIIMAREFQGQKVPFQFQSTSQLVAHLERCESGNEIWLTFVDDYINYQVFRKFIERFASVIYKITIKTYSWSSSEVSLTEIQKVLCKLPNLSYLSMTGALSAWKSHNIIFQNCSSSESEESFLLPQVQTVSLDSSRDFYPGLLISLFQVMPNLNSIFNFPLHCISELVAEDPLGVNLGKIKSVNFSTYFSTCSDKNEQKLADLSQLENMHRNIKLEMARLCLQSVALNDWRDLFKLCCESFSSILQNNKSTLQYLIIEPFVVPQFMKYPEMKSVKKIRLYSWASQANYHGEEKSGIKFFQEGLEISKIFPNLMDVKLEGKNCILGEFLKFLPDESSCFQGVTSLTLKFDQVEEVKELVKLSNLFPDVTKFSIDGNFPWLETRLAHVLRLWPNMISLKLWLKFLDPSMSSKFRFDPVFTGIPAEKCTELRKHQEKRDIDLKTYRENFSVSNTADLKELTLVFDGQFSKKMEVIPIFSHVTVFYGFQCLPNLKVTFAIPSDNKSKDKIREMLSPIEKSVIFNPNYYEPPDIYENLSV